VFTGHAKTLTIVAAAALALPVAAQARPRKPPARGSRPAQAIPAPPPTGRPFYSPDGRGNNPNFPLRGASGAGLLRFAPAAYSDGRSAPAGAGRPGARALSNALSAQAASVPNDRGMSDFVYVFGQFLDHDIDLSATGSESFPVPVPAGDPSFDPRGTGTVTIPFSRSKFAAGSGTGSPRQQLNAITAFVDGSQVYGSDASRARALRTFSGGRMKTSAGNMLPFNSSGLENANDARRFPDSSLFLAGDVRANENPELVSLQTLFVREHNRTAAAIAAANPRLGDEQLYQRARQMVIAELQAITWNEFLPALLGPGAIPAWRGYRPSLDAGIANEFSTAAFRFGHSLLDGEIGRLNNDGTPTPEGPIALRDAFFNPSVFDPALPGRRGDIDPFLKSASAGTAQEVDLKVVDDVRNFLFGPPGSGGLDLAALNIQRGRDHGLPDYNTARAAYGLPRVTSFAQVTPDATVQRALQAAYGSVSNVDLWVGGLAEGHAPGASVGPLFRRIIADQFTRLRDGDRLYYENTLRGADLARARSTTLARVIRDNTSLTTLQPNVFFAPR